MRKERRSIRESDASETCGGQDVNMEGEIVTLVSNQHAPVVCRDLGSERFRAVKIGSHGYDNR